jgi:DNA-binding transcriptional ArsR family regulator
MILKQTTHIPNILFDKHLPKLTEAELKILLIIFRQTNGWIDLKTGQRKLRDRISHNQFILKTGLSRRVISTTIQSLLQKGIICVTDFKGNVIHRSIERKGKSHIYYSSTLQPVQLTIPTSANKCTEPVQKSAYNKTKFLKLNKTKPREMNSKQSSLFTHISNYIKEIQTRLKRR